MSNGRALKSSTSQSRKLSVERITTIRPSKGRHRQKVTKKERDYHQKRDIYLQFRLPSYAFDEGIPVDE